MHKSRILSILLMQLLLRFAAEILQYHNENERDGEKLILGFNQFLTSIKNSPHFIGEQGVFNCTPLRDLLETIEGWIMLFADCVDLVKMLNKNIDAMSKGLSFLQQQGYSLLTVLVAKYLQFLSFKQGTMEKFAANFMPSLKIDIQHVEAISQDNLARTVLKYEQEVFQKFLGYEIGIHLITNFDFMGKGLKDYPNSYILVKNQSVVLFYVNADGKHKPIDIEHSHKLLMDLENTKENTTIKLTYKQFNELTLNKRCYPSEKLSVIDFELPELSGYREHLIVMMEQYIERKFEGKNENHLFSLDKIYNLIINKNQLKKMLEKLSSLNKAFGLNIFMGDVINLDIFKERLITHSKQCNSYLSSFNSLFPKEDFEVLRSAAILKNRYSVFRLNYQSRDLMGALNDLTTPQFLKKLVGYFRDEMIQLLDLQEQMGFLSSMKVN